MECTKLVYKEVFGKVAKRSKFIPDFNSKALVAFIDKEEFNLPVLLGSSLASNPDDLAKQKKVKRVAFSDKLIAKIPLLTEPPKNTQIFVELIDDECSLANAYLLLRITHKEKAFYIKTRRTKATPGACRKIAVWQPRDRGGKGSRPPVGYLTTVDARKEFHKLYEELSIQTAEAREVGDMTIRNYVTNLYAKDRENCNLKSGKRKKLRQGAIDQIIQGFPLWIDRKIKDVRKEWVQEFVDYWDSLIVIDPETKNPVIDPETQKPKSTNSSETRRKKYTIFNAMFNMCAYRGYIAKNPIDGEIGRFPRSKFRSDVDYDYVFEEVIDHIFQSEDIKGSLAGKIVIATMILCGARNSEVYRNYTENFDIEARTVFIPAHISKNDGERKLKIDNDTYWKYLKIYLDLYHFKNQFGHMFPSLKRNNHATEAIYRPVWQSLQPVLNQKGRLYDVRHTFARRVERKFGISKAAEILGDSIETAHNHYVKSNDEERFATMEAVQQDNPLKSTERKVEITTTQTVESGDVVQANEEFMPDPVLKLFNMFKNGKVLPAPGQIYASQWQQFVDFVAKKHERSDLGEEVEDWLLMQ